MRNHLADLEGRQREIKPLADQLSRLSPADRAAQFKTMSGNPELRRRVIAELSARDSKRHEAAKLIKVEVL